MECPRMLSADIQLWAHDIHRVTKPKTTGIQFIGDTSKLNFHCPQGVTYNTSPISQTIEIPIQQQFVSYPTSSIQVEVDHIQTVEIKWKRALCFDNTVKVALPAEMQTHHFTSFAVGVGGQEKHSIDSKYIVSIENINLQKKNQQNIQIFAKRIIHEQKFTIDIEPRCGKERQIVGKVVGGNVIEGNMKEIFRYLAKNCNVPGYNADTPWFKESRFFFTAVGTITTTQTVDYRYAVY